MFLLVLDRPFVIETAVIDARESIGMKHDRLAFLMGISGPCLSQQLAQRGHLSLRRLVRVAETDDGQQFWRAFWPIVAAHVGIEDKALAVQLVQFAARFSALIETMQVRMVKADLDHAEERKHA